MKIIDSYNAVVGSVVAVLSYLLGPHWILFALFLGLNVAHGLDEKQNCSQGELQCRLERGTQKAWILAYDCSSIWSKHSLYRNW